MSLRSKILVLFIVFALGPLLAVGVQASLQSLAFVEDLAESRVAAAGERAARGVASAHAAHAIALDAVARAYVAGSDIDAVAEAFAVRFDAVEVVDGAGRVIERLTPLVVPSGEAILPTAAGDATDEPGGYPATSSAPVSACGVAPWVMLEATLPAGAAGGARRLVGRVAAERLFGVARAMEGVGQSGYTFVVDRRTGDAVWDPACMAGASRRAQVRDTTGALVAPWLESGESSQFAFRTGALVRTGMFVSLDAPPWTVVASTIVDEFTLPRRLDQAMWLLMVGFIALAAAGAFAVLITHQMRSLRELTGAAGRIGGGDFTPWLPPPSSDEVGRLSLAVGQMVARLKLQMRQLERSRQMAVIGEMASHLSHEIRNPLSSIKLNLQSLDREVRRGEVPPDLPEVIELCLREMQRLDGVVSNVLRLGRPSRGAAEPHQLHALLEGSLRVMRAQLAQRGIAVDASYDAELDTVLVDADQVSGALLNIYLNAADAMRGGGTLRVWTELVTVDGEPIVRAHIADDGPGIAPEDRERIFEPFFTTKSNGSGIGLPLALQTIEAQGGALYLEQRSELERGAEFVISLAIAADARRKWKRAAKTAARPYPAPLAARQLAAGQAAQADEPDDTTLQPAGGAADNDS